AFTGCVHVEEATLRAMVVDVARSMIAQGFDRLVVVNCHFEPEHVRTLHEALDIVKQEAGVTVGYLDLTRRERAKQLTEEFRHGESHADRYETSLVLAERPELVDEALASTLPTVPINMARAIAGGVNEFREMGLTRAYAGSPAAASAAEGEETYGTLAEMLLEVVHAVADGTGGRDEPGLFGR
ncbi:MAG: creatininase family protein, partial [Gaiellaceae bacterium]